MRAHGIAIGLSLAVAALAACSSSTSPGSGSTTPPGGGSNSTITANYSSSGGAYGGGNANWWFAPTPDTVAAGTAVTFAWSGAQHNVHFDTPGAPDSVATTSSSNVTRTFSTPGTYSYHCTIHSMTGMVVVH